MKTTIVSIERTSVVLTIKIEMWPGGFQAEAYEIGRMYVYNVSNLAAISNYRGVVCRKGLFEPVRQAMDKATRAIEVNSYPRTRLNVWCLITRALLSAFPEERKRVERGSEQDSAIRRIALALHLDEAASEEDILVAIERLKTGRPLPPIEVHTLETTDA